MNLCIEKFVENLSEYQVINSKYDKLDYKAKVVIDIFSRDNLSEILIKAKLMGMITYNFIDVACFNDSKLNKTELIEYYFPKVCIIGMPFSGKSTLCKRFNGIDLDEQIEVDLNCKIPDFVKIYGIENFRKKENYCLKKFIKCKLIAIGGGCLTNYNNLLLLRNHQLVYLNVELETLLQRCDYKSRPLIKSDEDLIFIFCQREQLFNYIKTGDYDENFSYKWAKP